MRERWPQEEPARAARPLAAADARRYAVPARAAGLAAEVERALAGAPSGEPIALRLEDPHLPSALEVTLAEGQGQGDGRARWCS